MDEEEDTYTIPYAEPSYLGDGVQRKRIKFVPASSEATASPASEPNAAHSASISEWYLSKVLKKPPQETETSEQLAVCKQCGTPIHNDDVDEHERSIVHQASFEHIYPPSAIDRTRKGFSYLQAKGWDPDTRTGLGAQGEGRREPIKVKEKKDKAGIGITSHSTTSTEAPKKVVKSLSTKQVRAQQEEERRKQKLLQTLFYSKESDERIMEYFGPGS
ncbi:hypothetical protein EJ06DRAFT_379422 [Trichodelitschia bisporula]|uniref:G-patch domain-containing protein n=1 Tax=Trichodelitschia bisporula TaxID=703511 RepID=A0A6G1HZ94_9PEZI|nr:hypothetical protein EJ06DRAFT_379422 [Trichodelitschia bisporula]